MRTTHYGRKSVECGKEAAALAALLSHLTMQLEEAESSDVMRSITEDMVRAITLSVTAIHRKEEQNK